jgi:cytochrome b subunit of formate dehydrogenase
MSSFLSVFRLKQYLRYVLLPALLFPAFGLCTNLFAQSNSDCLACHGDESLSMEKNGKQVSLFVKESVLQGSAHGKVNCVACHTGFDPTNVPHKEKITPIACTSCHQNAVLKHSFHSKILNAKKAAGTLESSCKQCHGTHDVVSPKMKISALSVERLRNSCGKCHTNEVASFAASAHGKALDRGDKNAASCISCHAQPIIMPPNASHQDSLNTKQTQQKLCLSCHLDNPEVSKEMKAGKSFFEAYKHSIHAQLLEKGNAHAANCVSCHSAHDAKKSNDQTSNTNKQHVYEVCGKCHTNIAAEYRESIHGVAVSRGNREAPTCSDCHGEHNIMNPKDARAPVSFKNVSGQVCASCHTSMKVSEKYGLKPDRMSSFDDSYHGLALKGGSVQVANCASCHGTHNIKPSSDSTSTIAKNNLVRTCGKCHQGANKKFVSGNVHVSVSKQNEEPLLYWIATSYLIMILVVIGGMLIHNVLDFFRKGTHKLKIRRGHYYAHPPAHRLYVRMTLSERIQHASLVISFAMLVLTGFMLRFPNAWWVEAIRSVSSGAFELRSLLHRISAVVMVAASLYHTYYILFVPRGRQLVKDLLPKYQDLLDAVDVFKYNLGFSKDKPKFARFSYIEKSEYWALVWGTIVMGLTGVIMWFENYSMGIITKLGWDVARTIHYYEAWLATLAIIVWHFYFIMFNPDVYPMNLAWFKGTLTESEMEEEHPLELEEIKRREENEGDILHSDLLMDDDD